MVGLSRISFLGVEFIRNKIKKNVVAFKVAP